MPKFAGKIFISPMFNARHLDHFQHISTPFYYYDLDLLEKTLKSLTAETSKYKFTVHYAMKANTNPRLLKLIHQYGLGADLVFAGVGKSDAEINLGLDQDIFCFNCESVQELEVIDGLAAVKGKKARIALRINPNVNAHTHHYITTGLEENKFGINIWELDTVIEKIRSLTHIELVGIHFHIGSQITDLSAFRNLCTRVNELQEWFLNHGVKLKHVNVGGGLGIDYHNPDTNPIPDFASFFKVFGDFLKVYPGQEVHFELGRAIVAQCGNLVSRVLYIKHGKAKNFVVLDAGMTELIRPALYQSYHQIENLSKSPAVTGKKNPQLSYDVVGPICESSDCFAKAIDLPDSERGDVFVLRSAGAYGEVMASNYNLREKAPSVYSSEVPASAKV
jgi:diaminopimelate decarboxylase